MKKIILLMVFLIFVIGCQTTSELPPSGPPPGWVIRTPEIKGMICSVGTSGPTYYREDAQLNAAENARAELARTISVSIKNIMVEMSTAKGSSVDDATVSEVSSWATTAAVENSSILEYWYDSEGRVSEKNFTYALGCMPRKFNRDELAVKLVNSGRTAGTDIQEAGETADDIIKHLEGPGE